MIRLSAIYCYPVKSCRGVAMEEARLGERGIVHDREFLVVDAQDRFMTQRVTPKLARVVTGLAEDALYLRADGAGEISVPWRAKNRAPREVVIWRDTVVADDAGDEAAGWLSEVLDQRCRLVTMSEASRREVPAARVPPAMTKPVPVAFPDAFPLLVLSEASLDDLNRRVGGAQDLAMDRFRPNLVVAGCDAYAEDGWRMYRIGDARLTSAGSCVRCIVTTTDQRTLGRGPEPLRTLAGYRRAADGNGVIFGQNVIHEQPGARLRVGDAVTPES